MMRYDVWAHITTFNPGAHNPDTLYKRVWCILIYETYNLEILKLNDTVGRRKQCQLRQCKKRRFKQRSNIIWLWLLRLLQTFSQSIHTYGSLQVNQSMISLAISSLSGSNRRSCKYPGKSLMDLSVEGDDSYSLLDASGSVTVSDVPWSTKNGTFILLRFCCKYDVMRRISQPVLTLIAPVKTRGSEYLMTSSLGSRETGIPILSPSLNWYIGATRDKIGATI